MYKYLSIFLTILLLIGAGFYFYERASRRKIERLLYNEIAKLEGIVKESDSSYSVRATELENLKLQNKQLQNIIESRSEELVALGEANLRWKKKYFDIKNAKEEVVGKDGTTAIEIPADCEECLKDLRFRVDFDQVQDYLKIKGYTLTNPAEANIEVSWERSLKLSFILAKNNKNYKLYFDSSTPDVIPGELTLIVDPSVFEKKWYEKINLLGSVVVGRGLLSGIGFGYDVKNDLSIFGSYYGAYDDDRYMNFYGGTIIWKPFLR